MTKKTFSKVIAAVLVTAMCITAVFTGTVSAASKTADCTVVGRGYDAGNTDYLAADVTISSAAEFVAGTFTVSCDEGLVFLDASVAQSNTGNIPEVYMNVSNNKVLFAGFKANANSDMHSFEELKLVLKFTVASGSIASLASGSWNVTLSDIDITNVDEDIYSVNSGSNAATTGAGAAIHIHAYGEPVENNGIETYECSICHAKKNVIVSAPVGTNELATDRYANVTFTADGDTVLNALVAKSAVDALGGTTYFTYSYKDDDPYPKTATSIASGTVEYDTVKYYVFPCGKNGGIGRINRSIKGNFINVQAGGATTISADWEYSIKDYAVRLITDGAEAEVGTKAYKNANYAKALWNYGYYTTVQLNNNAEDVASYNDNGGDPIIYDIAHFALPTSKNPKKVGSDSNWSLLSGKVTTGFKPKMALKFNAATVSNFAKITIEVKDGGDLVYSKEVSLSGIAFNDDGTTKTYEISDIPTKYLVDDIIIGVKDSNDVASEMTIEYSFGRYAKARADKSDANVFQSMMDYSKYLNEAFASN